MTRRLRYSAAARDDLAKIALYIARKGRGRGTASQFVSQLRRKCAQLAGSPFTLGRERRELRPDMRSYAMGNYVIFFRYLEPDVLEVVNVLEGHRDLEEFFKPKPR